MVEYWIGQKYFSNFFKIDLNFNCIIANAEDTISHKYIVQYGGSVFMPISETVGNSLLIPCQNPLEFLKLRQQYFKSSILTQYNLKMSWGVAVEDI